MKIRKLLTAMPCGAALAGILLIGWGCSDPPEPSGSWNTPEVRAGLNAALQGWVDDFGLYGAAMRVTLPGNRRGSSLHETLSSNLITARVSSYTCRRTSTVYRRST